MSLKHLTIASKPSAIAVFTIFLKLGLIAFGGPVAHLAYFRDAFVTRRQWVNESQFGQLIAICQFLPGPSSSQLGFSLGLIRAGWLGGLAAFLGFTLPAALLMLAFASLLSIFSSDMGQAVSHGLKIVACVVVADAVRTMFQKLCPDWQRKGIALAALCLILLVNAAIAQGLVLMLGAVAGIWFCRTKHAEIWAEIPINYPTKTAGFLLFIFLIGLTSTFFVSHAAPNLWSIAQVFYQAGAMVFGGGHVVLPLLENAVVTPDWVSKAHFFTGYGLAQCIPGPLFSFSAYLGALIPTGHNPLLGALTALVFIFLPGLLLITAALPFWRLIARHPWATNAIVGINAAVVGLLAAALYNPIFISAIHNFTDLIIATTGFLLLSVWRLPVLGVVLWCIGSSVLFRLLYG